MGGISLLPRLRGRRRTVASVGAGSGSGFTEGQDWQEIVPDSTNDVFSDPNSVLTGDELTHTSADGWAFTTAGSTGATTITDAPRITRPLSSVLPAGFDGADLWSSLFIEIFLYLRGGVADLDPTSPYGVGPAIYLRTGSNGAGVAILSQNASQSQLMAVDGTSFAAAHTGAAYVGYGYQFALTAASGAAGLTAHRWRYAGPASSFPMPGVQNRDGFTLAGWSPSVAIADVDLVFGVLVSTGSAIPAGITGNFRVAYRWVLERGWGSHTTAPI